MFQRKKMDVMAKHFAGEIGLNRDRNAQYRHRIFELEANLAGLIVEIDHYSSSEPLEAIQDSMALKHARDALSDAEPKLVAV